MGVPRHGAEPIAEQIDGPARWKRHDGQRTDLQHHCADGDFDDQSSAAAHSHRKICQRGRTTDIARYAILNDFIAYLGSSNIRSFAASFSSENSLGKCVRFQIPLKLAWALTIHKCQVFFRRFMSKYGYFTIV